MKLLIDQELLAPWIAELPEGWKAPRIDDFSDVFFSNVDKHTIEGELPARLCNYVDVYKNDKITHEIEFMEASADAYELERFQIRKGDVLLTKDSEEPDDIAIASLVAEDLPGVICGYHLALIRSRSRSIKGSFLAWVHKSKPFRAQYEAKAVGVTRFGLSQYAFRSARIPLPVQDEQERISAYLDKQCTAIDKILEIKKEQLTILEELRKSIIHKAVTKGLDDGVGMVNSEVDLFGGIPRTWRCGHLKRFANRIQAGVTPPTETADYYFDGTVQWFTPSSYCGHIELREPRKLINELAVRDGVLRVFPAGTIFFIGIGATIGKVGIIKEPASCNQQIIGIVCNHRMNGRYLAYQMKIYEDIIPEIASATTLAIFDQVKVGYLPILLPSLREQKAISDYLDQKLTEIRQSEVVINQQIDVLLDYRKSLIHECVTGKRRITEDDLKEPTNV